MKLTKLLSATAISIGVLLTGASMASARLDEIIDTATKRAESLQDVPVYVIATKGEDIESLAMTNAAYVMSYLPAITV